MAKKRPSLQSGNIPEPKIIKYSGGVNTAGGLKGGMVYGRPNMISNSQKIFQSGHLPIHLKGPRDMLIYKGAMYGSLLGLTFAAFAFYRMALPRKNN